MAKPELRERARELRTQGLSLNEIRARVPVSKGTLSIWLRDVPLGAEQMRRLAGRNGKDEVARAKFTRTMQEKREARHGAVRRAADEEYEILKQNPTFLVGLGIYIGEGNKSSETSIGVTNCDPRVMRKALRFYEIIGIRRDVVRCTLQLHPGNDEEVARAYWQRQLGLLPDQFNRALRKVSPTSTGSVGPKQPHGICTVYVYSMPLWLKVLRWMELALQED